MTLSVFKNKTALVTGASSGIGDSFARQLAAAGANLILVARREDRLQSLKQELEQKHGIKAEVIAMDLSDESAAQQLFEQTEGQGKQIDVLINNAGYGKQNQFTDIPLETQANMLNLNINTLTALSHLFGEKMKQRRSGHILLVGSIASFLPVPNMATYGASKAYVRSFGEALNKEMQPFGVKVSVLNPGGTATEFIQVADQEWSGWMEKVLFMSPERTAQIGLKALARGRASVVAGCSNSLGMFLLRFIPRAAQTGIAAAIFK